MNLHRIDSMFLYAANKYTERLLPCLLSCRGKTQWILLKSLFELRSLKSFKGKVSGVQEKRVALNQDI